MMGVGKPKPVVFDAISPWSSRVTPIRSVTIGLQCHARQIPVDWRSQKRKVDRKTNVESLFQTSNTAGYLSCSATTYGSAPLFSVIYEWPYQNMPLQDLVDPRLIFSKRPYI